MTDKTVTEQFIDEELDLNTVPSPLRDRLSESHDDDSAWTEYSVEDLLVLNESICSRALASKAE